MLPYSQASQSHPTVTPWTVARQAPLSMRFSQKEYWSGLPLPPPGDLPNPGIEPVSLSVSCNGRWVLYHRRHLRSLSKSTHFCIYNRSPTRTYCGAQETLLNIMQQPKGGKNLKKSRYRYMYNGITLLYS